MLPEQTATMLRKVGPSDPSRRDLRWLPWLMALVVWAQALYIVPTTIYWTLQSIHSIPYWDAWETIFFLKSERPLTLGWLWSQHNEHRILIPKLISLIDYRLFRGCGYFDIAVIWLLQIGSALLMTSLCFDIVGRGATMRPWRILVCGLVVCLAFSAAQMENFYWPVQTNVAGVIFFSILAFFCLKHSMETSRPLVWVASGATAAIASELCLSSGVITVIIVAFGCLIARGRPRVRFLVVVALLAFAAAYLIGYHTPSQHSGPLKALHHPVLIFQYFFVFLGNAWINQPLLCAIMGSWGLSFFSSRSCLLASTD